MQRLLVVLAEIITDPQVRLGGYPQEHHVSGMTAPYADLGVLGL